MALIRLDHTPSTVQLCIPLYVILPDPGRMGKIPLRRRKVLYLLHGLSDDASAWQRYTTIETTANAYGLVVVMPSVGRSFYADQPDGMHYFSYLSQELPAYLKSVFGLAPKREDTLIAGLSMGGYGAMKMALNFPERFAAAASFSGMLSLEFLRMYPNDPRNEKFAYLFGDLKKLHGSAHDPVTWLKNGAQNPAALPRLYASCGRQDDLYPLNQLFRAACQQFGIPLNYHEEDAKHDWLFWEQEVKRFIKLELGEPPKPKGKK